MARGKLALGCQHDAESGFAAHHAVEGFGCSVQRVNLVHGANAGGARVVLATVTHGPAMTAALAGLAPSGRLMVLGAAATAIEATPLVLIMGRRAIEGWCSGTSIDAEETLAFSAQAAVRSMNEFYPLDRAAEAYDRMASGKARFRVVLTMHD